MAKAFVYVMTTVTPQYEQEDFCNVPTQWGDRLYFGPCKIPMRPRMAPGGIVCGVSPASTSPRRLLFVAEIAEVLTFAKAFERFPELRGPSGPIHVRPVNGPGPFPISSYEHIPDSIHRDAWQSDLASPELDAFFVCSPARAWRNRWLGSTGPVVDQQVVDLLNRSPVYGKAGLLADRNQGSIENPVAHGRMYSGLHVEVADADELIALCEGRMRGIRLPELISTPRLGRAGPGCGCKASAEDGC